MPSPLPSALPVMLMRHRDVDRDWTNRASPAGVRDTLHQKGTSSQITATSQKQRVEVAWGLLHQGRTVQEGTHCPGSSPKATKKCKSYLDTKGSMLSPTKRSRMSPVSREKAITPRPYARYPTPSRLPSCICTNAHTLTHVQTRIRIRIHTETTKVGVGIEHDTTLTSARAGAWHTCRRWRGCSGDHGSATPSRPLH